jgi:hypothetical protein
MTTIDEIEEDFSLKEERVSLWEKYNSHPSLKMSRSMLEKASE